MDINCGELGGDVYQQIMRNVVASLFGHAVYVADLNKKFDGHQHLIGLDGKTINDGVLCTPCQYFFCLLTFGSLDVGEKEKNILVNMNCCMMLLGNVDAPIESISFLIKFSVPRNERSFAHMFKLIDVLQLDRADIRNDVIAKYVDFTDIQHKGEFPELKLSADLPLLVRQRPKSAMDIHMLYLHSGFQCQKPVGLINFGEKIPVNLHAELSFEKRAEFTVAGK